MSEPITQAQDHDRRIGRLEGIAEQLDRRLDGIERLLEAIRQEHRRDFRWLIGVQITTLIAMGSMFFSLFSKLPG